MPESMKLKPRDGKSRSRSRKPDSRTELAERSEDETYMSVTLDTLYPLSSTSEMVQAVNDILDRKWSSQAGREKSLEQIIRGLTECYAAQNIFGTEDVLVDTIMKCVKMERTEKEALLALQVLSLLVITAPTEEVCEIVYRGLQRVIMDSTSTAVKAAAIHTFGLAVFCSRISSEEILALMTLLLEIISSDGHFVDAGDDADVVVAALQEWGMLASGDLDLSEESEDAVEVFVDQLESTELAVQIAAGENIALLFERSYAPPERDDPLSDSEEELAATIKPKWVKRYNAYRRTDQLVEILSSIVRANRRSTSRQDRRVYRTTFTDILNSIENPRYGPRYSTALRPDGLRHYGTRMNIHIHNVGNLRINNWWQLLRLQGLRRVLQGGFMTHYEMNKVVWAALPIAMKHEVSDRLRFVDDKPNKLLPKSAYSYISPQQARASRLQ